MSKEVGKFKPSASMCSGRHLFEEIIREHLDLGRPEQVSLIFERRLSRRTPGRFWTRVITQGVTPSLRQLQVHQDQAVLQGRAGLAHRDHDHRQPRFRPRPTPAHPARPAGHRLRRQPPRVGGGAHLTGLSAGRSAVRSGQPAPTRRRPARRGPGLRRSARDGPVPVLHQGRCLGHPPRASAGDGVRARRASMPALLQCLKPLPQGLLPEAFCLVLVPDQG
jgi:hypothetical protein